MITKFDSLYAGHVDMDNLGYAGTAVNDRSFSRRTPGHCLRQGHRHRTAVGPVGL